MKHLEWYFFYWKKVNNSYRKESPTNDGKEKVSDHNITFMTFARVCDTT